MSKVLMKGNEVLAESAIKAGCRFYFGYPITPQTEISHYMAKRMEEVGGTFIQAESEIAAINMLYGASAAGARVLTSSAGPGISLKQEGISYLAGAELPAVVVNMSRCGPGLGGILPSQSDYFQAVKGGGHGDYRNVVFAPSTLQELYEITIDAFNIADKYRIVCMIMGEGMLAQMMETVEFRDVEPNINDPKEWACIGTKMNRKSNIITSINTNPNVLEDLNLRLQEKYKIISLNEKRVEEYLCEDAEVIITAFGTMARIVKSAILKARNDGIKVGLIRPITLWPFPNESYEKYASKVKAFLTVEINAGQMVEDVRLAVGKNPPVYFYGRMGGHVPSQTEILNKLYEIIEKADK